MKRAPLLLTFLHAAPPPAHLARFSEDQNYLILLESVPYGPCLPTVTTTLISRQLSPITPPFKHYLPKGYREHLAPTTTGRWIIFHWPCRVSRHITSGYGQIWPSGPATFRLAAHPPPRYTDSPDSSPPRAVKSGGISRHATERLQQAWQQQRQFSSHQGKFGIGYGFQRRGGGIA